MSNFDAQRIYHITRPEPVLLTLYILRAIFSLIFFPLVLPPLLFRYYTLHYRFDGESVRKSYGLIFKHEDLVQYARIQDLHLSRGLLERWLGLGTIQVQTASGSGAPEVTIEGFTNFEEIRDFLYAQMRGARFGEEDAGQGSTAPAETDEVVTLLAQIRDEVRLLRGEPAVIYEGIKGLLLTLLRAPAGPPKPPAGSPGSVQVFRASPQFLRYKVAIVAVVTTVLAFVTGVMALGLLVAGRRDPAAGIVMLLVTVGILLFGLMSYFITRLEYDLRYYLVTDRSLRVREGVWAIDEVTLTYANVQHLEIRQGPIQQMLGIADLIVRTAGGAGLPAVPDQTGQLAGHKGALSGIDNAEEIRDLINSHLKHYRHAGLGDPEERRRAAKRTGQLSPAAVGLLKEIRDELTQWRLGGTAIQQRPSS